VLNKSEPGRQRGFDRFEIETPLRVEQVGPIRIQRPDGSVLAADFSGASLTELPLSANGISIEEIHEDRFIVSFPLIEENDTVLSIEFDSGVLRFGTTFAGRAFNSALETTVGQSALAGNAADLKLAGFADFDIQPLGTLLVENLSVAVPISKQLLANVGAEPPIFTPNGDGINDQVLIKYDVTNIARLSPVEVFIYDLSGRLVRQLVVDEVVSGRFARPWDGRSDSGQLVPPGNYIYSVLLKADTEEIKEVGVTRVAY
jgi:gliding motility-associated-like protein